MVCIKRRPIEKVVVLSIHGYVSIYRRLCCTLLYKIRCESRASGATHKDYKIRREIPQRGTTQLLGLLSPLNNLSIRCEIPLHKAGRWGFETTSRIDLTLLILLPFVQRS